MPSPLLSTLADMSTDALHQRAVERVIEALHRHSDQPLTLGEMARIALISPYHFIRVFHRMTGISPVRYQWSTRLAFAKRLLVETEMSVIDVCFEAGYNSLGSFTKRFSALVGIPPHHFRLAARNFDPTTLPREVRISPASPGPVPPGEVSGIVEGPPQWEGFIFAGLFPAQSTQSLPSHCCVITRPGSYRIGSVPDGRYQLCAAAVPRLGGLAEYFLYDGALRAAAGPVVIRGGRVVSGDARLKLREPKLTDLPILTAIVPLLQTKIQSTERQRRRAAGNRLGEPGGYQWAANAPSGALAAGGD